jgi:type I restriction enzyme R subunit
MGSGAQRYRFAQPLLKGEAKAMVVVGSRIEAVRWQLAIEKYIKAKGYKLGTLVAFSGEVNDPASGPDPFTESSKALNPDLNGRDIREAFKLPEFHILLVANKFQTGFDQPLLCGMYVDRRLAGIQAVQTLSRLNRAHPGKDTTYVLDFVNSGDDILKAFRTYYETATLADVTDPNLVYDLRAKLDSSGHYDDFEVDRVVKVELDPASKQGAQQATNNSKEQFANSPDLSKAILDAVIDAFEAHSTMSKQALDSAKVREGLKDVLLGPGQLYEALRDRSQNPRPAAG